MIGFALVGVQPAQAEAVDPTAETAMMCAQIYLTYGDYSPAVDQLIAKTSELSGRGGEDLHDELEKGAANLRTALFQRTLEDAVVRNVYSNICPPTFGIPAPPIKLSPAPPLADPSGYQLVMAHVWECRADIPDTLERDSTTRPYRLRLAFTFDGNLRATGKLEVYDAGVAEPFASYPLTGWPYRGDYANGTLLELGAPQVAPGFPEEYDWKTFRIDFYQHLEDGGRYHVAGQIDRRSDDATRVNMVDCAFE